MALVALGGVEELVHAADLRDRQRRLVTGFIAVIARVAGEQSALERRDGFGYGCRW